MKRFSFLVGLAAAAIIFTGCGGGGGGGGGGYVPPPDPGPSYAVLYLDFADLSGVSGVYYDCEFTGDGWTDADGGFYYDPGEVCTFDLIGFPGSWDTPLYIDYGDNTPASGIYYECWYGSAGTTDWQGEFIYDTDDSCSFYL